MTLQPDPPQDLSQFLSIANVLDDYKQTEKEITKAAYDGTIKLYFFWYGGKMIPFPNSSVSEYFLFYEIPCCERSTYNKETFSFKLGANI